MKTSFLETTDKIKNYVKVKCLYIYSLMILFANRVNLVRADAADDVFWGFMEIVEKWLVRIGGVVAFVGAIMFALGWQREDAEAKTRGMQTMMAGVMVMAIAVVYTTFVS